MHAWRRFRACWRLLTERRPCPQVPRPLAPLARQRWPPLRPLERCRRWRGHSVLLWRGSLPAWRRSCRQEGATERATRRERHLRTLVGGMGRERRNTAVGRECSCCTCACCASPQVACIPEAAPARLSNCSCQVAQILRCCDGFLQAPAAARWNLERRTLHCASGRTTGQRHTYLCQCVGSCLRLHVWARWQGRESCCRAELACRRTVLWRLSKLWSKR